MKKCLSILLFSCLSVITGGQTLIVPNLSQEDANRCLEKLKTGISDTARIDILLRLAFYNVRKDGEQKSDLDSAAMYITMAKEINSGQASWKRDGSISLYEASIAIERGDTAKGQRLAEHAIKRLQPPGNEIHLTLAYMQLYRSVNPRNATALAQIKNIFSELFQRVPVLVRPVNRDSCLLELMSFYNRHVRGDVPGIKLDFLNRLVQAYKITNNKIDEFWARKEIADVYYQQGKLTEGIDMLLRIAKEQEEGAHPRICFTYDLLSALYMATGNFDKSLHYSFETIKHVHTGLDSFYLSNFYSRIAGIYSSTGSTAEAINWNIKRLNHMVAIKKTNLASNVVYNIVSDMIKLGKQDEALHFALDKREMIAPVLPGEKSIMLLTLATCYSALNRNNMAEKYCEELIKINDIRIKQKDIPHDLLADQFIASFYFKIRQYDKAEMFFNRVLNAQLATGRGSYHLDAANFRFKLDSARGNYISAIRALQKHQLAKDSLFTAAKSEQLEELKAKYSSDQKDSLINFKEQNIQLLTLQAGLQKSKLKQGVILRNISFIALGLLIITVALLYNRYRLKQKTNKKLESQQAEIETKNFSLHHLLDEKDWLLKEIHHRVKNNLQIVMSLLNSQTAYIDNQSALTAIHDSQHRVHAMSLIHQKLYGSANISSIEMSLYIRELVSYLSDSFNVSQRIRFEFYIEPIEMDVSHAVPMGLILNEAITNSLKYAFPDGRNGVISISLSNTSADQYLLSISDNGIGMPAFVKKTGSLGMSLMRGLSEDIDGNFSIENNKGTTVKVSFSEGINLKRPGPLAASLSSDN